MEQGMPYGNSTTNFTGMEIAPGIVGPDELEIMSEMVSLVCITALATGMGNKTYGESLRNTNYGRILVLLLYTSSWAFCITSAILVSTNNNNMVSCTLGMMSCDVFYAGSKVIGYAWLMERVHIVTNTKTKRLKTCVYRFHLALLCPYIIIFVLMLTFRNIYLTDDGKCIIGLQFIASIPLMIYDFMLNLYLTWLFMRPLMNVGRNSRMDWKRSRLYRLARRTLVASVVCLLVSFINVFVVVLTHGNERGLVCLTMCTVDVTVNVMTVHWVTSNHHGKNKDGAATTRIKNAHTTDANTVEMTFDDQETFSEKPARLDKKTVQIKTLHEDDDDVSDQSSSQPQNSVPLHRY
ncbi:uncharacterized protein BX664DRAFT_339869 [Halteromyces radiatus]|uniref:uncharacterized protein n=1 Tax=Halteromyces radiatus TaxID=101107 RepID=UPI00221FDD7B|nr:uncharacterized protein BX664DRAFT_339869 [Halteromyces radiatus]KAI8083125.1 hypothetical protein BX664DRAFT_339869 [Halteromyces radiatus]